MNNYNLQSIKEKDGLCFLGTSFYSLPAHASVTSIEGVIESGLDDSAKSILKSGILELYWKEQKDNLFVLNKLLSADPEALFLPDELRMQVLNTNTKRQPYCFFIESVLSVNHRGSNEMRLRFSCEVEPNRKGFKHGYHMDIILGTSIYKVSIDGGYTITSMVEQKEIVLPNNAFL